MKLQCKSPEKNDPGVLFVSLDRSFVDSGTCNTTVKTVGESSTKQISIQPEALYSILHLSIGVYLSRWSPLELIFDEYLTVNDSLPLYSLHKHTSVFFPLKFNDI